MSIAGWGLGIILILMGIVLNNDFSIDFAQLPSFFDITSVVIVIGGCFASLMVSYPGKSFGQIPKHLKIVLFPQKYNPIDYVNQLVDFAKEARINGLLALESKLAEVKDDFMKSSLLMVVDAVDAEKVKEFLEMKLDYLDDRHSQAIGFYEKGANYAPAFGMIGTLIGLVKLLQNMSDPAALGASMSIALITTFYGSVLSNLVFNPIATKLKARHEEEFLCKMIICEGVQAIQSGDNPKFISEKLMQLLPNSATTTKGGKNAAETPDE